MNFKDTWAAVETRFDLAGGAKLEMFEANYR
jgi:hypothetical protein